MFGVRAKCLDRLGEERLRPIYMLLWTLCRAVVPRGQSRMNGTPSELAYHPYRAGVRRTRVAEAAQWTEMMCRSITIFHDGSMEGLGFFFTRFAANEAPSVLDKEDLGVGDESTWHIGLPRDKWTRVCENSGWERSGGKQKEERTAESRESWDEGRAQVA